MKSWKFICCFAAAIFCALLFSAAEAEGGNLFLFRIRPQVVESDAEQKNDFCFIGTGRNGKQKTARLCIGCIGRSPEGNTWDLAKLSRECSGSVLHAWWRVEARNPGTLITRFILQAENNACPDLRFSAAAGWNLWDLTDWMEQALTGREDLSCSLKGAKKSGSNTAELALGRSWIYITMQIENPPFGLEGNLVSDSELLDIALSALPEEHWALKQYQEVSGSLTQSLWPEAGVPYYYGGHSEDKVLYHRFFPLQESRYYKPDKLYLCGFDCGSYLHWVEEKAGYIPHDSLSTLLRQRSSLFPMSGMMLEEWNSAMLPGDMLVFNHGTYHIGMVLGTPRMFGLTAENTSELKEWLDAPLIIHCGEDPFCYDRFKAYIEKQDFRMDTNPPDGGVTVSLLIPQKKDAPHQREAPWKKEYGYFTVLGQPLLVFPLEDVTDLAWFRPVTE